MHETLRTCPPLLQEFIAFFFYNIVPVPKEISPKVLELYIPRTETVQISFGDNHKRHGNLLNLEGSILRTNGRRTY